MNPLISQLLPTAINMIRQNHTHVMSMFHQYKSSAPSHAKKGMAETICTALKIQRKSRRRSLNLTCVKRPGTPSTRCPAERSHMKRFIALLRQMELEAIDFDDTVRGVLRHIADQETVVLPAAKPLLVDSLGKLGVKMTQRRVQLVAPRSGEIIPQMGRAASGHTAALSLAALAAAAGLLWAGRIRLGHAEKLLVR